MESVKEITAIELQRARKIPCIERFVKLRDIAAKDGSIDTNLVVTARDEYAVADHPPDCIETLPQRVARSSRVVIGPKQDGRAVAALETFRLGGSQPRQQRESPGLCNQRTGVRRPIE